MKKGQISFFLRKLRLMYKIDYLRFYIQRFKNRKTNKIFKQNNPEVNLPPDYLIYESFRIDYQKYYFDGQKTTQWLLQHIKKHIDLKNKRILDWGCGPGRIIRHLPQTVGNNCEYYGTDYNKESIEWCAKNLNDIKFNNNTIEAKLPYSDDYFDVIYGISIFTHLSEQKHYEWYNELYRILNKNGIMFLTTQGDNFKTKLTDNELKIYNDNNIVVRGNVKEGHRTYSAFHPKEFMKKLFKNVEILEHLQTNPEPNKGLPQDIWIIKKITF